MDNVVLRPAREEDAAAIAAINSTVFLGDRDKVEGAQEWVACWMRAYPLYHYFVLEAGGAVAGYAGWQLHGGFHRAEPVIELDQIGVDPKHQGRGFGPQLTAYCMAELARWLKTKNTRIESHITFVVWAYALNLNAVSVYAKSFTDGPSGFRIQFGQRAENMLRVRWPIVMLVRN